MIIIQLGDSTPLQVTIEGTGRVEACIRENITYTCNVSGPTHRWTAPSPRLSLPTNPTVTPSFVDVVTSRYTLRLVSDDGVNIISSLTVISDVGFNNTNITCSDARDEEVQQTLAIVLGEKGFWHNLEPHLHIVLGFVHLAMLYA